VARAEYERTAAAKREVLQRAVIDRVVEIPRRLIR
jgi:hypothetical protein